MIRLFVTDLDGTLLRQDEEKISDGNLNYLSSIAKSGIKTVIATGRSYSCIRHLFNSIEDNLYYIVCDGALCLHKGKVVYSRPILREEIIDFLSTLKYSYTGSLSLATSNPADAVIFYGSERNYVLSSPRIAYNLGIKARHILSINEIQEQIYKLSIHGYSLSSIDSLTPPTLRKAYCSNNIIEYVNKFTNKASALSALQSMYCIMKRGCVAVGDGENDVQMLKRSSHAYALSKDIAEKSGAGYIDDISTILKLLTKSNKNN